MPRLIEQLAAFDRQLEILQHDRLGLLELLAQLAHFRAVVGVVVPLSHELVRFVLELTESGLSARSLERQVQLVRVFSLG